MRLMISNVTQCPKNRGGREPASEGRRWRSTLLANRLPQETARKCKNYINLQSFCYGLPTKATKTNELDTFKDIN